MMYEDKSLKDIWVSGIVASGLELRLDFKNDRHHATQINPGDSRKQVAQKLRALADNLLKDKELD